MLLYPRAEPGAAGPLSPPGRAAALELGQARTQQQQQPHVTAGRAHRWEPDGDYQECVGTKSSRSGCILRTKQACPTLACASFSSSGMDSLTHLLAVSL